MRTFSFQRIFGLLFALLALGAAPRLSAQHGLAFDLVAEQETSNNRTVCYLTLTNTSLGKAITKVEIKLRSPSQFDFADTLTAPAGGTISVTQPTDSVNEGARSKTLAISTTGFESGKYIRFRADIDDEGFDIALFGLPGLTAVVTIYSGNDSAELELPFIVAGRNRYTASLVRSERNLEILSRDLDQNFQISRVTVKVNGQPFGPISATNMIVREGDNVEISAPEHAYYSITKSNLSDSVANDPELILKEAEERFTAAGIQVNNVSQPGDPTYYQFEVSGDTSIFVKWTHEYALTVFHDFADTESLDKDSTGKPWAGPLTSGASGNPNPTAQKHWVLKGTELTPEVDGSILDFNQPGLDVRYVPKAYRVWPSPAFSAGEVDLARERGTDIRNNPAYVATNQFSIGQSPGRQQIPRFTMTGPVGITYVWQIQFGVHVYSDEPAHAGLAKVFEVVNGTNQVALDGEGVRWFDRGANIYVVSATNSPLPENKALGGWFNGDGYYFSNTGEIDSTDGSLSQGGPALKSNGDLAAQWVNEFAAQYRGVHIQNLQRAARVLWRYGGQQLRVQATIGEFVFQGLPLANVFINPPTTITRISVPGANANVGGNDMVIWDPVAARLYPLVPGIFRATWLPVGAGTNAMEVTVNVRYPTTAHYPHIAGTPGVALDPDPADNFIFDSLKYTENQALVDNNKLFTAGKSGKSVLLFREIQRVGRGTPREFYRVRVVHTKTWNDGLPADGSAIIGQKISDAGLDLARLGTGFVMFDKARYNPLVYDRSKFEALAAKDVYDMTALRSSSAAKVVANPGRLAGPVIPVNLHPGAASTQRVVVVWYDDPTQNDELLWPHRARTYIPRWPTSAAEGLGRIVIASQFGSESVAASGDDQIVVEAVTNVVAGPTGLATNVFPAETTYNPSRLQQTQIYNQPDPAAAGYNPNEEHGLLAPSLRYAAVSPRPSAVYALRNNDLNQFNTNNATFSEAAESSASYTSHPFVLVQFFDTVLQEFRMRVYKVQRDDLPRYGFADPALLVSGTANRTLEAQPHITMEAGEPVIPFYPLLEVVGASPCSRSTGDNFKGQSVYWEDHKGSSWAVSGGDDAWFSALFHYPLLTSFWWPPNKPGFISDRLESGAVVLRAQIPQAGDCVSFLPNQVGSLLNLASNQIVAASSSVLTDLNPVKILFKSDWPLIAPVLKAGETLTYSGGENRADNPFTTFVDDTGDIVTIETPGLPGVVAFAAAEVVFDTRNPLAQSGSWKSQWTARVGQVLDKRSVPLRFADFPAALAPATKRSRLKQGKYIFTDLPASLQKRVQYDPLGGQLLMVGYLNDKEIGDNTLTASPGAVYLLEPNILTADEKNELYALSDSSAWRTAVDQLYRLTRNPASIDSNNTAIPAPTASDYRSKAESFWRNYYDQLAALPPGTNFPPVPILDTDDDSFLVGLGPKVLRDGSDNIVKIVDAVGIPRVVTDIRQAVPQTFMGPGLAVLPNPEFLNPSGGLPEISWVVVAENNDPSLGGSPVTLHVVKVDRRLRYRGAIKTTVSDNVFDENLGLRHTGDFGANAGSLVFEWWYRFDDGSVNVPPPDLIQPGQINPWKVFPDPSGNRGRGRYQITLKGNPNVPEALLADSFWFCRYRHDNDAVAGTNWKVPQPDGSQQVNFTWAGAGNSDPFHDFDADGFPDYRAQLAQGWIKRVLDAVNPYEARIRSFEGDSPSTLSSMLSQFGPRFEGPVALNPDKNVIENVGLIELYETVLKRARDLSIDLSRPVSTPAIANALELASTRLSDFYTLLGNEAYVDSLDPTIGFGSEAGNDLSGANPGYGSMATAVFAFQNQVPSLLGEELALLRGVDDNFARPVYNRLFWNFTKDQGEAAYAVNYNITDVNMDGFIDEEDAMILFPQGHGDAWGHYLSALRHTYDLLRHPYFNWVSRSESYNLQDIVISVDFLDERKFARAAAAKAKAGAEVVNQTYREKYVEDPNSQWQGYTDSNKDRSWGVDEWARRVGQGAYFDWIVANALLPSRHPNTNLTGIQKVDRQENSDISVVSANLNAVQRTIDNANKGNNPLGVARDGLVFDIDPTFLEVGSTAQIGTRAVQGLLHFDQIFERAIKMMEHAVAVWDKANESRNNLRQVGNSEAEFRNSVFQEDLAYKNQLIKIFGRPYEGTIGPGKVYPAGYDGPDLLLYMYVDVRTVDSTTVPQPTTDFANSTYLTAPSYDQGAVYRAFESGDGGSSSTVHFDLSDAVRQTFAPTFAPDSSGTNAILARNGLYSVKYTDLTSPKVPLVGLTQRMPVKASGYTFQAPRDWGRRLAVGDVQVQINQMLQQEAQIASAIGVWDGLQGAIIRQMRLLNARVETDENIRAFMAGKIASETVLSAVVLGLDTASRVLEVGEKAVELFGDGALAGVPRGLPTGGLSISPGDALAPAVGIGKAAFGSARITLDSTRVALESISQAASITKDLISLGLDYEIDEEERDLAKKESLVELENLVGDEPIRRIEIFKEIEALRGLGDQYAAMVDEGTRLIDERAAFNKRVAAQTQRNRYQDMTFRVSQNHALQNYRQAFDLAARYAYLAAKAYDYETNYDPADPASPSSILQEIIRARTLGKLDGEPRMGAGGLCEALAKLKENYEVLKGQLGINNPQIEIGKASLRTEHFRILPKSEPTEVTSVDYLTNTTANSTTVTTIYTVNGASAQQPATNAIYGYPEPGQDSDEVWKSTLRKAIVPDLWMVPEFRYYCRPFGSETNESGAHMPEPGIVIRFHTDISAGKNMFGRPLSGGDHTFDPTHYATKIQSAGVWFSDYLSSDPLNDLPATPRVYLVPIGSDIMSVPNSPDPNVVRIWNVLDQRIPVPFPATLANLDASAWIPAVDALNGRYGEARKYSTFRAYHDGGSAVNFDELVADTRLVARSAWNTQWMLVIPGRMLNADPDVGLERFIEQVSDIRLVFRTYSLSGN